MATKPMNLRLDDAQIADIRSVAGVFHMSFTDVVREALREYLPKKKKDPYYLLTQNIPEVTDEENEELAGAISALREEELQIAESEVMEI